MRMKPFNKIFLNGHYFFIGLFVFIFFSSCNSKSSLFTKLSADESGIDFNNLITENDSINPIDLEFLYNGGGVGVGDFNRDGLPDLYFTASTVSNKLYLNKGNMKFDDITTAAGVDGMQRWCNGVSVVDINNDGWEDIYVSATIKSNSDQRTNLLYINKGLNQNGIPVFKEMAHEYGLGDTGYSVQAAFFDYDNDGDLDMYLVTTGLAKRSSAFFNNQVTSNTSDEIDRLFRNDWNDSLHHPVFTDVSNQAGITELGFGLGIAILDINQDGWKDIYVTNDYYGSDLLYVNNKNGTFTNKIKEYFNHTSQNAMGIDNGDINNDGLPDMISVDMNPEDNFRKKKNMGSNNYFIYQTMILQDHNLQYVRNTLQLNQGLAPVGGDTVIHPVFSDIGFFAGVAETDWSWAPLIADMDNDGNKDIFITNGYPRDVTDHDFMAFRDRNIAGKKQLIDQMPQIKVSNYAFRNMGNLKFENNAEKWSMSQTSFSNGAVYVDLDNDGDLDFVVNNINDPAFVYRNNLNEHGKMSSNYLQIKFIGGDKNKNGIGAVAKLYYDSGKQQVIENSPYRGYLSTVDTKIHFGLGNTKMIDSVIIRWPGNKKQKFFSIPVNQLLIADIKNAQADDSLQAQPKLNSNLFTEVTSTLGINYVHQESEYIDFNYERLLPHKLSQYGPGLAAGDVDLNGLDDIVIGGTDLATGKLLLQQTNGKFILKDLPIDTTSGAVRSQTMGILLFDADVDGDLDLYCTSGSNRFQANSKAYQNKFYENDGKGNFKLNDNAIPRNYVSKSCIKATDIDNDGDLDLFLGGRVLPGKYPQKVSSFIYRNDSKDGKIKFTDVTDRVAPGLQGIGLVCDAIWTDFDNDGFTDLIVVGEWMPVTFFKNNEGKFINIGAASGIADKIGWWNSITAGDFDNDGDIDYIVGNLGQNSFYRPTNQYPVKIYVNDFDKNGTLDAFPTVFLKHTDGTIREFTAHNRDDIMEQIPVLKKNFLTYKSFANADIKTLLGKEWLKDAVVSKVNWFQTSFIKNNGKNNYTISPLPPLAQLAPVYGMITDDFNDDGNLDVALSGNDYGGEVSTGRYDAMKGLVMLGDGKGNFIPQSISQSGLYIPGDGKALIKLRGINNALLIAASQNKGPLQVFKGKTPLQKQFKINADDRVLFITLTNGNVRKEELYYGTSFLSQSSGCIGIGNAISKISVVNLKGAKKNLYTKYK